MSAETDPHTIGDGAPAGDVDAETGGDKTAQESPPWTFWAAIAPGALMILFGFRGLLEVTEPPAFWSVARWFVGGNLAQDLLISPLVCVIGFALARWLPARIRGPIQGALVICGVIGLASYPLVRRFGATPGEPSFLDRDYGRSVLFLWGYVWLATAGIIAWRFVRARRR